MRSRALGVFLAATFALEGLAVADPWDKAKDRVGWGTEKAQEYADVGIGYARKAISDQDIVSIQKILSGSVSRFRRSVSFGPMVGATPMLGFDTQDLDGLVSFGLGFYLFKIPVLPTPEMVLEVIKGRAKAKLIALVKVRLLAGEKPTEAELITMGKQVFEETKQEVLGQLMTRSKLIEYPRLGLGLEGSYMFSSDAWQVRLTPVYGIWKLTLGPTFVTQIGDGTGVSIGPEIGLHLMLDKGPRPLKLEIFWRMDFAVHSRDSREDDAMLGVRLLLDII